MEAAQLAEQYGGIREARFAVARLQAELVAMEDRRHLNYDTESVAELFREAIGSMPEERFAVIFMDLSKRQIGNMVIYPDGSTSRSMLYQRKLFRDALARDATAMVICHNHPSGTLPPSPQDCHLTRSIDTLAAQLEITLVDHIIVTSDGWKSFKQMGQL